MEDYKINRIIEDIEEQGLRVKAYESLEDEDYKIETTSGIAFGKGPVIVLVIRE